MIVSIHYESLMQDNKFHQIVFLLHIFRNKNVWFLFKTFGQKFKFLLFSVQKTNLPRLPEIVILTFLAQFKTRWYKFTNSIRPKDEGQIGSSNLSFAKNLPALVFRSTF